MSSSQYFDQRTTKGIHKKLILQGGEREKEITKKFSLMFGITFSKSVDFKNTVYTFNFLQPGKDQREMFNMSSELLQVFLPFPTFDLRVFDFIDKLMEEFKNRLDKSCVVLVSGAPNFKETVHKLGTEKAGDRLVVPFTYSEFWKSQNCNEMIKQRFREFYFDRDLFAFQSPLNSDAYFYGRGAIVQELNDKYVRGEQSGLFGLRKSGKTSVLYALERIIRKSGGLSIFIDCQNPDYYSSTWNHLLREIVIKLYSKYNETYKETSDYDIYPTRSFFEDIKHISTKNNKRVLIILDEIEYISLKTSTISHWKNGDDYLKFWQAIRSSIQQDASILSFIVAGVNPYLVEQSTVNEVDNPIFSMVNITYLKFFDYHEVKKMVSDIGKYLGVNFEEPVFGVLSDEYGGHPYLIRNVCSRIYQKTKVNIENRPYTVHQYEVGRDALALYNEEVLSNFEQILGVLKTWYPDEYVLLEQLVFKGKENFKSQLSKASYVKINHLVGYGLIEKHNDNYYLKIRALENYLTRFYGSSSEEKQKSQIEYISNQRNQIEVKLRKCIKLTLSAKHGKTEAKKKIIGSKIKEYTKASNRSLDEVIENLYFSDYVKIIVDGNWSDFQNIFIDKDKTKIYLKQINENRIDAHAKKDLPDDEFIFLKQAFSFFGDKLHDY